MGCSASHEEPPKQQPSTKKPTQSQAANPHPSLNNGQKQPVTRQSTGSVSKDSLSRYIQLEKEIHQKQGHKAVKDLEVKQEALETQNGIVKSLEDKYTECKALVEKEKKDVDYLVEQGVGQFLSENEAMAKEKEEYVEALNKEEITRKELDEAIRQREMLASDVDIMKKSAAEVQKLIDEQEDLLDDIFGGAYGSELENDLEREIHMLEEKKGRINSAKHKWTNGRVLIQYAVNQLGFAVRKWQEVSQCPPGQMQQKYTVATEARNNVVAANQNVTSTQTYLHTIEFPYCKPAEMVTLQRATNNIYTDMQTPERHAHALHVYSVTYKRACALLQWFDHVIQKTILKDFNATRKDYALKAQELRQERIRLIQEKVKAELGETVEIQDNQRIDDDSDDEAPDLQVTALAAKTGSAGEEDKTEVDQSPEADPLQGEEMAPAPSTNDLFGDIDELKKQHDKDMEEYKRQQDLNKARIDQDLQEKLARRRSRKKRMEKA